MKCTLTNDELINKAHQLIKSLAETGGKSWKLRVPVDFNNDPDIIFSELCNRLKEPAYPLPVNSEGWVKDKPDNDHEFLMVTATLIKDRWNYTAWEINEIPVEGYFGLCELDGEEWGPYEDLSADLYFILPSPPTNG